MTEQEINEMLLLLLRQQRLQSELLDDFGALLHAVRELVVGSDGKRQTDLEQLEAEAKAATFLARQTTLRKFDDIIRKLESLRKPRVN